MSTHDSPDTATADRRRRSRSHRATLAAATVLAVAAGTLLAPAPAAQASTCDTHVTAINTAAFPTTPVDTFSTRLASALDNSTKYAMGGWWTAKNFAAQAAAPFLSFGGVGELEIRDPSNAAFLLATSLTTSQYDPAYVGFTAPQATATATRLVSSLAYRHLANLGTGGWGNAWQSALWATNAGAAGWMLWGSLTPADRLRVCTMVQHEANRFLTLAPPYYMNTSGVVLTPGDSKAEENAWNSGILALAASMMPTHPNHATWTQQAIRWALSAQARPNDRAMWGTSVVNGQTLNTWLNGSNLYNDGTIVNHNLVHPEYQVASTLAAQGIAFQSLAQKPSALGYIRGFTVIYKSLVDQVWTPGAIPAQYAVDSSLSSQTVDAPGGRVYHTTSSSATVHTDIYYPMGNDWGPANRGTFTLLDAIGDAGTIPGGDRFDQAATVRGDFWGPIHIQKTLNQQARFTDGRTFLNSSEFGYPGREMQGGQLTAWAYMFRWLKANGKINVTNASHTTY